MTDTFEGFTTHMPYAFFDGMSDFFDIGSFSGYTLHMPHAFFDGFSSVGGDGQPVVGNRGKIILFVEPGHFTKLS